MNTLELLVKSAQANHGRKLEAPQVKEVLEMFQALQNAAVNSQARLEGLTRIATVQNTLLGESVTISESAFDEAEDLGLQVDWDEEGGGIEVTTYRVEVPVVQVEDDSADDAEQPNLASVPEGGGAPDEVEGTTPDA